MSTLDPVYKPTAAEAWGAPQSSIGRRSLSASIAGKRIKFVSRLGRSPFLGFLIPVPGLCQIRLRVGRAELLRRNRIESLRQQKGGAGIVSFGRAKQQQTGRLQIAGRQQLLRPPDETCDFIWVDLPHRRLRARGTGWSWRCYWPLLLLLLFRRLRGRVGRRWCGVCGCPHG